MSTPLLFLSFINDISNTLFFNDSKLVLYADNSALIVFGNDPVHLIYKVNTELSCINSYCFKNLLMINAKKSKRDVCPKINLKKCCVNFIIKTFLNWS